MQDLEERFTLFVALAFVVAEDLLSTGQLLVDGSMVWECVKIFLCEMLVDVLKHVTLAKFNNVRPGTYREFFRHAPTLPAAVDLTAPCFTAADGAAHMHCEVVWARSLQFFARGFCPALPCWLKEANRSVRGGCSQWIGARVELFGQTP